MYVEDTHSVKRTMYNKDHEPVEAKEKLRKHDMGKSNNGMEHMS